MKHSLWVILLLLSACQCFSQHNDYLLPFTDKQTGNKGFKDKAGHIVVPAYLWPEVPDTLRNIAAVFKIVNEREGPGDPAYGFYFVLKNGKVLRRDHSGILGAHPLDCECEGKILYADSASHKVGFLDSTGHVVLPAQYAYATPFYHGVSMAFADSAPLYRPPHSYDDVTNDDPNRIGRVSLIDEKNNVLAVMPGRLFPDIDRYSMLVDKPADTGLYHVIPGNDGHTYAFISYRKEFNRWLRDVFLPRFTTNKFIPPDEMLDIAITTGRRYRAEVPLHPAAFKKYYSHLLPYVKGITYDSLVQYPGEWIRKGHAVTANAAQYYSNCHSYFKHNYPAFVVGIRKHPQGNEYLADNMLYLVFIRAEKGYKLCGVLEGEE